MCVCEGLNCEKCLGVCSEADFKPMSKFVLVFACEVIYNLAGSFGLGSTGQYSSNRNRGGTLAGTQFQFNSGGELARARLQNEYLVRFVDKLFIVWQQHIVPGSLWGDLCTWI